MIMKLAHGNILNRKYADGVSIKNILVDTAPLVVLGFGKNWGNFEDFEPINRVDGRKDYQFIFIESGFMDFVINNQKFTYGKNTLVLFRPGEPQIYNLTEGTETKSYFIHFSGSEAEKLLDYYGITEQIITFSKPFAWFNTIFNEMESQINNPFKEDVCNNLLATLLGIIGGVLCSEHPNSPSSFQTLTHMMRANCTKNYPISKYADFLGYSEIYFIEFFKQKLGKTPHQYIIHHRLKIAKQLLLTTKDSVKSIAVQVGYPNSRYFSRVFYKKFRLTPSEFRAQNASVSKE